MGARFVKACLCAAAFVFAAALLQGCIYVPHTTTWYDEQCKIEAKHMTLRPEQIGALGSCSGRDCVVALAAFGVIAAASAVVSGSIVVVGNVVYWLEKQGKCALS
jgi:hypothetical protein